MADEPDDFGETVLHLAGTRPAMVPIVLIPWTALVLMIGVTALAAEFYWKFAIIVLPVWPLGFWIFKKDHNGLRVFGSWLRTAFLDLRAWWFGGTSLEAFPRGSSRQFRGIPDADA